MDRDWNETLGSLNGYVESLRTEGVEAEITVVAFDTVNAYDTLRHKVALADFQPITHADAMPRGGTPLWDAAGRMIAEAEGENEERTIIVIITDGMESYGSSTDYTQATVKEAVARVEARNWQVVFLGANFDTVEHATSVGLSAARSFNMIDAATRTMGYDRLVASSTAYATTGRSIDLSVDE